MSSSRWNDLCNDMEINVRQQDAVTKAIDILIGLGQPTQTLYSKLMQLQEEEEYIASLMAEEIEQQESVNAFQVGQTT